MSISSTPFLLTYFFEQALVHSREKGCLSSYIKVYPARSGLTHLVLSGSEGVIWTQVYNYHLYLPRVIYSLRGRGYVVVELEGGGLRLSF
jgi:hypothetical protein